MDLPYILLLLFFCLSRLPQLTASPSLRRSTTLSSCLSSSSVPFSASGSSTYKSLVAPFNQRLPFFPAAVILPTTVSEISSAVLCASQAGIPVVSRSGGHSYTSLGLGGQNGSLVIDLRNFNTVKVNQSTGVATIGGGNRLGDVATQLNKVGRGLAHGTCPYVGVGGHSLLGGFGFAGRMWGLMTDQIVALDVVLANGTSVHVTQSSNAELFFALRGAGTSFGVVHTFYFQTHVVPSSAVVFTYEWDSITASTAVKYFLSFQNFVTSSAPAELGITANVWSGGMHFTGVYYGTETNFEKVITPLLNSIGGKPSTTVKARSWIESIEAMADGQSLNTSSAAETRDDFYAKSLMTPISSPLTSSALTSFFNFIWNEGASTKLEWFVEIDVYGGAGSVVSNTSLLATSSFANRAHLFTFQLYASSPTFNPPYPSNGITFVTDLTASLTSKMVGTTFGGYANYPDSELTNSEWESMYYGGGMYKKLVAIKNIYDPKKVFNFPQSIGTK